MCTLIVLHACVEGSPLLVAANRDEYFERPAEGPALRTLQRAGTGDPAGNVSPVRILAPRDAREGGTWLGLNEHGLFAALTNRRCDLPDPNRRSRGHIVTHALKAACASAAAETIESLDADAYNPFNLLVADRDTAHVFSYDGTPERIDLAPGAHVIGNVHPLATESLKLDRLRREVAAVATGPADAALASLGVLCASHTGTELLDQTCVHAGPYGTRSSSLLRLSAAAGESEFHFCDGAPCERAYEDFTTLLSELGPLPPRCGN